MKFILRTLLIAGASYLAEGFLPWWNLAAIGFIIGLIIPSSGFSAFLSGALGGGLLWLIFSWFIQNESLLLSEKLAPLFFLNTPFLLVIVSGTIGALIGGLFAMAGTHFRKIFMKEREKGGYYQ